MYKRVSCRITIINELGVTPENEIPTQSNTVSPTPALKAPIGYEKKLPNNNAGGPKRDLVLNEAKNVLHDVSQLLDNAVR